MKKIAFLLALTLIGITTHLYYVFRPIEEVEVSEMALALQSPAEQYEYHRQLSLLLVERDPDALKYMIQANCDGEGCYDRGKTLVQVLIKLGDPSFSKIIPKLHQEESDELLTLLSAGHEYGDFSVFPDQEDFKRLFPLTFRALNRKV